MKKFWEKFTDRFSNTIIHPQFIMFSFKKEALKEVEKYAKNKNLIDIGCGRMPYRSIIEPITSKYVGVDDKEVSKLYNSKYKPEIYADVTKKIPVKNSTFDVAMMFEVIEYLIDPLKTFSEIRRILKKNGVLILTTPFLYPLHDIPYDRNRFTDTHLRQMLAKNNFTVKKIKTNGNFLSFWFQSLNVFLFKSIMDILKSKKDILKLIFLLVLVLITPVVVVSTNLIFLLTKWIKIDLPNYFPLDYFVVAVRH